MSKRAVVAVPRLCTQADAATIATRMGRDPRQRGSVAWPFRRAIERDPTEGRGPPNSFLSSMLTKRETTAADAGRKVLYEVGRPPQGWASSRRCLKGNPRGASKARDDRYEVNLPVVPAGTPSARAEADESDQAAATSVTFQSNSVPLRQIA